MVMSISGSRTEADLCMDSAVLRSFLVKKKESSRGSWNGEGQATPAAGWRRLRRGECFPPSRSSVAAGFGRGLVQTAFRRGENSNK